LLNVPSEKLSFSCRCKHRWLENGLVSGTLLEIYHLWLTITMSTMDVTFPNAMDAAQFSSSKLAAGLLSRGGEGDRGSREECDERDEDLNRLHCKLVSV
jgi:hypothetical protein